MRCIDLTSFLKEDLNEDDFNEIVEFHLRSAISIVRATGPGALGLAKELDKELRGLLSVININSISVNACEMIHNLYGSLKKSEECYSYYCESGQLIFFLGLNEPYLIYLIKNLRTKHLIDILSYRDLDKVLFYSLMVLNEEFQVNFLGNLLNSMPSDNLGLISNWSSVMRILDYIENKKSDAKIAPTMVQSIKEPFMFALFFDKILVELLSGERQELTPEIIKDCIRYISGTGDLLTPYHFSFNDYEYLMAQAEKHGLGAELEACSERILSIISPAIEIPEAA